MLLVSFLFVFIYSSVAIGDTHLEKYVGKVFELSNKKAQKQPDMPTNGITCIRLAWLMVSYKLLVTSALSIGKPNIILILVDDMGWGHKSINTRVKCLLPV